MKKINQKFFDNNYLLKKDFFTYYKKDYNSNLDRIEKNLDDEINEEEEYRRERNRQRREYNNENMPIPLKRCYDCRDICYVCFGSIKLAKEGKSDSYREYTLKAHNKCLTDEDRILCCLCKKNKGTADCTNTCYYCNKTSFKVSDVAAKCYYCKKEFHYAYY